MNEGKKVVSWWSGGVTSAVTCKLCIDIFGLDNCEFIFIDTYNEDDDTYRFKRDCERWYGKEISTISGIDKRPKHDDLKAKKTDSHFILDTSKGYANIQEVWYKHLSLNVATGAICSSELKRAVRVEWEKQHEYDYQAFGFEMNEHKRAMSLVINYPKSKPIFPLLMYGLDKMSCSKMIREQGIDLPRMYQFGFQNNNCFKTGCVQGGIGYWQKIKREFPDKFEKMAAVEHDLTDKKGKPVTMLKDQGKAGGLVFLKPHPDYPEIKDISMMKGREPKPLFECNGFCGTNDLDEKQSETQIEINFDTDE